MPGASFHVSKFIGNPPLRAANKSLHMVKLGFKRVEITLIYGYLGIPDNDRKEP